MRNYKGMQKPDYFGPNNEKPLKFKLSYNGVINLRLDFKNGKSIEELSGKYAVPIAVVKALIKTNLY